MTEDEWIDHMEMELFETGAMYVDGIDEDGDFVVRFEMDKLRIVCPELAEMWDQEVIESLLNLSDKGLVSLDLTHEDGMLVELTDLGQEVMDIMKDNL